jgi:hypothetical protein
MTLIYMYPLVSVIVQQKVWLEEGVLAQVHVLMQCKENEIKRLHAEKEACQYLSIPPLSVESIRLGLHRLIVHFVYVCVCLHMYACSGS